MIVILCQGIVFQNQTFDNEFDFDISEIDYILG